MDAQQFLAEFGHIANAPGGVERLRELVLHLAVSGNLIVTESPVDAAPLLDSIVKQNKFILKRKNHCEAAFYFAYRCQSPAPLGYLPLR